MLEDVRKVAIKMIKLEDCIVRSDKGFNLNDYPTTAKIDKEKRPQYEQLLSENKIKISNLQDKLYADGKEGLVIVFQAMDAAGKDSTIRKVLSGVNPTGIDVYGFKQPSSEDLKHGFLWRAFKSLPARGKIAVFNRSYYEECLVVRIDELWRTYDLPDRILNMDENKYFEGHYKDIRAFERYLYNSGYRVMKIFLNVSADKQKERFLERIDDESKNWKFSSSDLSTRAKWDEYRHAFNDTIKNTATDYAPWYVIPADKKWETRWLVSEAILSVLEDIDPSYPEMPQHQKDMLASCRKTLVEEDLK